MTRSIRRLVLATALLALGVGPVTAGAATVPHVNHIWVIVLENKSEQEAFGKGSVAPYLSKQLTSQGALIKNYYGTGHDSNDNYIAMVSGQGPNIENQADCPFYTDFLPGTPIPDGQYLGEGCVYPPGVITVANQLADEGYRWKAYQESMQTPCDHPAANAFDSGFTSSTDGYVTKHNPFVYFHSITDFPTECAKHDVPFAQLAGDLQQESTTPEYSFITPNLCDDGHNEPCKNGQPGGLVTADQWLRDNVPTILNSPAYADRGLLMIVFDEAHSLDEHHGTPDSSACCGEKPSPNTPNNGGTFPGLGGGRTGAVLLSPCIQPGTVTTRAFNHYSQLLFVERNFGLFPRLGYARQPGLPTFGPKILNNC
jgi:hypothetical protein